MGNAVQLWDEFNPSLYKMTAVISDESGNADVKEIQFGMRSFLINGTRFEINNRQTYLRERLKIVFSPKQVIRLQMLSRGNAFLQFVRIMG